MPLSVTSDPLDMVKAKAADGCADRKVERRCTKPGHPWSNGKVERTQALLKSEVVIPILVAQRYEDISSLQTAIDEQIF